MRELRLTSTSPAQTFTEPVTRAEAEKFLELPVLSPVDAARDTLIDSMIVAAREEAEKLQNRDLVQKQWDLRLDRFPHAEIELRPELLTVDLVQYKDSAGDTTALTETTEYVVDAHKQPGIIIPAYGTSWPSFTPWPSGAVLIRFTSGLSSVPDILKHGMKLLVSSWYSGRLPFEPAGTIAEYPYSVTSCLRYKANRRIAG